MIDLKITMLDGREFFIRSIYALSRDDFIKTNLNPHGVELKWYDVVNGVTIRVENICSIEEYTFPGSIEENLEIDNEDEGE